MEMLMLIMINCLTRWVWGEPSHASTIETRSLIAAGGAIFHTGVSLLANNAEMEKKQNWEMRLSFFITTYTGRLSSGALAKVSRKLAHRYWGSLNFWAEQQIPPTCSCRGGKAALSGGKKRKERKWSSGKANAVQQRTIGWKSSRWRPAAGFPSVSSLLLYQKCVSLFASCVILCCIFWQN